MMDSRLRDRFLILITAYIVVAVISFYPTPAESEEKEGRLTIRNGASSFLRIDMYDGSQTEVESHRPLNSTILQKRQSVNWSFFYTGDGFPRMTLNVSYLADEIFEEYGVGMVHMKSVLIPLSIDEKSFRYTITDDELPSVLTYA